MATEVQPFPHEPGEADMRRAIELLQNAARVSDQKQMAELEKRRSASELLADKALRGRRTERINFEVQKQMHGEVMKRAEILVDQLLQKATKDSMTGLLNKQSFYEVAQEMHDALKTDDVILMFDIDDFKAKNSRYGHLEADKALIAISEKFKDKVRRETDLVASWPTDEEEKPSAKAGRVGGEEFAGLFPNADPQEIAESGKFEVGPSGELILNVDVRLKIQGTEEYEEVTITVSGALTHWKHNEPFAEALERANQKLNEIKASKVKNRILIAS